MNRLRAASAAAVAVADNRMMPAGIGAGSVVAVVAAVLLCPATVDLSVAPPRSSLPVDVGLDRLVIEVSAVAGEVGGDLGVGVGGVVLPLAEVVAVVAELPVPLEGVLGGLVGVAAAPAGCCDCCSRKWVAWASEAASV